MNPLPAARALDQYFLEARSKLLDLAAILDRIGRGRDAGGANADGRGRADQPGAGGAAVRRAEQGGADPADLLAGIRPELEAAEAAVLIVGRD